jgi:hypothetical protein
MDKFRKTIKTRIIIMRAYSGVMAIILILCAIFNLTDYETKAESFILGACTGTMLLILFNMRRYTLALKNDESMKKLYVEENDERHKFIVSKTGGTAINIVICGLALGATVSGFFSEVVFFTLLSAAVFSSLVKGFLKLYYTKNI